MSIGGDGCIFIWRLSTALQQAMHDRLCELYPECVISMNRTGEAGRVGNEPGGRPSPVNRTRAKEDAKARLKLHKSQLPAWASEMSKQPITPHTVVNANSSSVIDNLSQQQATTTTQEESESDSSDTFEGKKSSFNCFTPKLQQEGGGHEGIVRPIIDNRFSQEEKLIESTYDTQSPSNHFEGVSFSNHSEGCRGLEEKTCAGEGVDELPQQGIPFDDSTASAAVDVTYGWKAVSVQEDVGHTTTPLRVQNIGNEERIEEKKEIRGGISYYKGEVVLSTALPSNLSPETMTLRTPSKQRQRPVTESTKCNSEIEDDGESLACNQSSPGRHHLCDGITSVYRDLSVDCKNGKSVVRAKMIDESSSTEMGAAVIEVQNDNDEEAAAILPPNPRVTSCKIRENGAECSKPEDQSKNTAMNNNLNQSNEQMLLSGGDSGLYTVATATTGSSNSKTAGFHNDVTLTPVDSFALELPLPPCFSSQDKDVREEQDKGISRMHAKRKETEVGRMRK